MIPYTLSKHRPTDLPQPEVDPDLLRGKLCNGGFWAKPPGVRGTKPPEADDIFLFRRLISEQNYRINFGYLDYMASVEARLHQHIVVRTQGVRETVVDWAAGTNPGGPGRQSG